MRLTKMPPSTPTAGLTGTPGYVHLRAAEPHHRRPKRPLGRAPISSSLACTAGSRQGAWIAASCGRSLQQSQGKGGRQARLNNPKG
jgi:hypothetical protein